MKKITLLGISCALLGAFSATSVGEEVLPALSKDVLAELPRVDRNGDGKLTGREWTVVQKGILRQHPDADTDGDGILSRAEQGELVKKLGSADTPGTSTTGSSAATPELLAQLLKRFPESDAVTEKVTSRDSASPNASRR